jgi:hypothetical protein
MKLLQFAKFFFISVPLACFLYTLGETIQLIKKI